MNECDQLHDYRDELLEKAQRISFKTHLKRCEKCRETLAYWNTLENEIGEMTREEQLSLPQPNVTTEHKLVTRAKHNTPRHLPIRRLAAAMLTMVIIVAAFFLVRTNEHDKVEKLNPSETSGSNIAAVQITAQHISSTDTKTITLSLAPGDIIPSAENARTLVLLGRDQIGFRGSSEIEILEVNKHSTRLKLLAGNVACMVDPRKDDNAFIIEAGRTTVRVVGTRFMVSRTKMSTMVIVEKGSVEILIDNEQHETITAGQSLEILANKSVIKTQPSKAAYALLNQLISQKTKIDSNILKTARRKDAEGTETDQDKPVRKHLRTSLPGSAGGDAVRKSQAKDLVIWRDWILAGRYADSKAALEAHLAKNADDAEALVLLADCCRKAGKYRSAAAAYKRLIEAAGPSRANMARFRAGVLYQEKLGEHATAAKMFKDYLNASMKYKPLEAETMLRLSKSLLALKRVRQAEEILKKTAARQDGSPATLKARELLELISHEKK